MSEIEHKNPPENEGGGKEHQPHLYAQLIHHPQYSSDNWHTALDAKQAELSNLRPDIVLNQTPEQLADLMTKEIIEADFQISSFFLLRLDREIERIKKSIPSTRTMISITGLVVAQGSNLHSIINGSGDPILLTMLQAGIIATAYVSTKNSPNRLLQSPK